MDPISIYAIGALVTTLATGAAGVTSASVAAAGTSVGMGAGTIGLTWPISLPLLAGHAAIKGIEAAATPNPPTKRDLVALEARTAPAGLRVVCQTHAVPVSAIQAAGGYQKYASGPLVLEKSGDDFGAGLREVSMNWRAGAVHRDVQDVTHAVTADWVGNEVDIDGREVANLRVCFLQPLPKGGAQ